MTQHPHQAPAVDFLASHRKGLLKSPAGSGKTLMAAFALHRVITAKPRPAKVRVGWIANTREQIDQAHAALAAVPGLLPLIDVRAACAQGAPDMRDREVLIVDESHHLLSPLWSGIVIPTDCALWLMSATPWSGADQREKMLSFVDGHFFEVTRESLGDKIAEARVVWLSDSDRNGAAISALTAENCSAMTNKCKFFIQKNLRAHQWNTQQEFDKAFEKAMMAKRNEMYPYAVTQAINEIGIKNNQERNRAIIRVALRHRHDSVLILVNSKDHAEILMPDLPGALVAHSKLPIKQRRLAIESFKDGSLWCLLATSLGDEGLDVPRANVLVYACGGKSSKKAEQRTGRVLRAFKDKTHGTIYDFKDEQFATMKKHSLARLAVYRNLNYKMDGDLIC